MSIPSLKKQLISSVVSLVLVAVFLVVSVTTYSWFSHVETVTAKGMQVSADLNFTDSAVCLCPVTEIKDDGYVFLSDTAIHSLPKYDKYNIDALEYQRAAVMMISFSTAATGIRLTLSTETAFSESAITSGASNYLSNVVNFYLVDSVAAVSGSNTEKTAIANTGSQLGFVSATKEPDGTMTFVKQNEIAVLSDYPIEFSNQPHVIYLIMVYNTEVAEFITPKITSNVLFESDITIHLERTDGA